MHHLHLFGLLSHHLVLLLTHGHNGVEDVGTAEKNAGQGNMVADGPEALAPFHDGIVGAEVVHPQETLAAQLDGVRHIVEHRNPDGHLNEHGQTAGEG